MIIQNRPSPALGRGAVALLGLFLALAVAPTGATAGDVTAFVTLPSPREEWGRGYGAALTSTWFQVLHFEGEAARLQGELPDTSMTTFTGSALLGPKVGVLTPYGGVGVGLFRQTVASESDLGTLRALIFGAKVRLGPLVIVKGEYRRLSLSGTPLVPLTSRVAAGVGISF
jgi:hypothetical protein